ncbi:MAG: hypothetical protein ABIO70_16485 [Pseudomonadota bacterium]
MRAPLPALGLLALVACDRAHAPAAPAPPPEAAVGAGAAKPSCPQDPMAMVEQAYGPYLAGQMADLSTLVCWSARTGTLLASRRLFYDPVVNAQDFQIADLAFESLDGGSIRATFTNFGTPVEVTWVLVREGGVWRVDDLMSGGGSLVKELQEAPGMDEPI